MSEYSSLKPQNKRRVRWQFWLGLVCLTVISLGSYLVICAYHLRIGFPLDDAWIHQTYARNLALHGVWAFVPEQPSGGSTSPLWTALLAVGYLLNMAPFAWTFLLGGLLLLGLALQTEIALRRFFSSYLSNFPWAGFVIILEWHFIWSAVSGMETILHAVVILAVALLILRQSPPWLIIGLLTGVSVWVRPDGITLIGPAVLAVFFFARGWKEKTRAFFRFLAGLGILIAPYLLFNYLLTGNILPNTFYAKQAEYAGWQAQSILGRSSEVIITFLTGSAVILLPGIIMQMIDAVRKKQWGQISIFLWMLGYLGLYMLRLPAYQHGRYLIPAMPVFFMLGLAGFNTFIQKTKKNNKSLRLLKFFWGTTLVLVCFGFWYLGSESYKADVEFVETEMVDTAHWVEENIPDDAIVAAHDIGALGYFDRHQLVDLAGLITPEVITFLLDEEKIGDYLTEQGVSYLIVFPDWYPSLTADLVAVFTTGASYAPSVGETNMTVYLWSGP